MTQFSNREIVERYVRAVMGRDLAEMDRWRHPDYVSEWPQSGERVRGAANARAIHENYPGGLESLGPLEQKAVIGSEDRWVASPLGTLLRITGTGDVYTGLFTAVYPGDPRPWYVVVITELRDGKVWKETVVFGAPFDPPDWRAQWVERLPSP